MIFSRGCIAPVPVYRRIVSLVAYPGQRGRDGARMRERESLSVASTGKIIVQGTIGGTDVRNETTRLDLSVMIG